MRFASLILAATVALFAAGALAGATDDFYEGVKSYRARQYDDAEQWFRKAAEQGDGDAQFLLGRMHYDGNSITVDYIEAHMWFELADGNGVTVAARYRDGLERKMKAEEVEEARRRAAAWRVAHPQQARER